MRLFAALYPPPETLDTTLDVLDALRGPEDSRSPLTWTSPDLLHVTTAFYGDVPGGAVADLADLLHAVARDSDPMELHLRGAGVFHDRVLWLGVGGDAEELTDLSAACACAGAEAGLRLDRRPRQRAHVTVARARSAARAVRRPRRGAPAAASPAAVVLDRYAAALAVYVGPAWTARELCLVESDLTSARPVHTVVERFALGG